MSYILMITKWYPNPNDPQLGVFIEKQAQAVAAHENVHLIYVYADKKNAHNIQVTKQLTEHIITFRKSNKLLNAFNYYKTLNRAVKQIYGKEGTPKLIHAHVLLRPALFAYIQKKKKGIPYIISEHWSGFILGTFRKKNALYKFLCRKVFKKAAAVAVVSEYLKNAIANEKLLTPNIKLIPNVIEKTGKTEHKEKQTDSIIILTVADLVDSVKNISGIIHAFSKISTNFPHAEYHIIGGGQDEEMLKELTNQYALLNKKIFFHGRKTHNEVMDFLPTTDFVVINSRTETFSMVAAEAMLFGKPVVATKSGGPEQFITEKTGILIDINNQQQLIDALKVMIENYHAFDPKKIQKQITREYSSEKVGEKIIAMYNQIEK